MTSVTMKDGKKIEGEKMLFNVNYGAKHFKLAVF